MKNLQSNRSGQFVIIAVLLIAIMIISMGALLHGAVTYHKHEPWEEYTTLIGDLELNSGRLLELSLADCTNGNGTNAYILKNNLDNWQKDLMEIYPTAGIKLEYELAEGAKTVAGQNLDYQLGIHRRWYQPISTSSAQCIITLGIDSIGLAGYKLTTTALLRVRIINYNEIDAQASRALVLITNENNQPIPNLKKDNFSVRNATLTRVYSFYDSNLGTLLYGVEYQGNNTPRISVWDSRGILVIAQAN